MDEYNNLSEEEKKNYDVNNLGEGVELVGYNDESGKVDLSQAFTKSSYKFDGIDDYIKIKYDGSNTVEVKDESGRVIENKNEKEFLGENGFTFEFYGKMSKGRSFNESNQQETSHTYMGILEFGKELRIGLSWSDTANRRVHHLLCNAGFASNYLNGVDRQISSEGFYCKNMLTTSSWWNNSISTNDIQLNDVTYFCLVVNPKKQFRSQSDNPKFDNLCISETLYLDDEKYEGEFNENCWYVFSNAIMKECNEWQVGRAHMDSGSFWHYLKGECYFLRFYNKALTEEQIKENRRKSEEYHAILESEE